MRSIHEIRTTLSNHRNHLFQAYPLKSMAIFGSYSREENTDGSDLDILVEFNDRIGIRFVYLADEIEEIVGIKGRYLKAIDPDLIYV